MRRLVTLVLALSMLASLTGCEAVAKKFRRKKKETPKMPRMFQAKVYETRPAAELYKKHYSYWASWQSELITVAGQNNKKDMLCISEIISNLKDMQKMLLPEKQARLAPHIANLSGLQEIIARGEVTQYNKDTILRTLEREDRFIRREFSYNKVSNYLKTNFDDANDEGKTK